MPMSYNPLSPENITQEQQADLDALHHYRDLAEKHEQLRIEANNTANRFLYRLWKSDKRVTFVVLAEQLGVYPNAIDKRLKRARAQEQQ